MKRITALTASGAFMMTLALVISLGLGLTGNFPALPPAVRTHATLLILVVMMTVSFSRIPFKGFHPAREPRALVRGLILGTLLPSCIPLIAWFLLGDNPCKDGLIFVAATPFAASVVSLSYIIRGDLAHAARSTIAAYLAAIGYIPLLVWLTLGKTVNIALVVGSVLEVILLPILLSRLLTKWKLSPRAMAVFLNLCVCALVVLSVGATADFFYAQTDLLLIFIGVAVLRTFGLGTALEATQKRMGIPWAQRVTDVLMASYKNKGIAIALCMATLPTAALFPITASIVVEICWVIFMDAVLFPKKRMARELAAEAEL